MFMLMQNGNLKYFTKKFYIIYTGNILGNISLRKKYMQKKSNKKCAVNEVYSKCTEDKFKITTMRRVRDSISIKQESGKYL